MQTVALFGGTGFVGTRLANRLTRNKKLIRIPTRSLQSARPLRVLPTTEIIAADIHNPVELDGLVDGCDAVVNLVGILNEPRDNGEGFRQAHVELTQKLLTACKRQGIRRYLHMSALHASPQAPSHYLRSKGEAEALVADAAQSEGLLTTIFRPSVIFGADDQFYNRFAQFLKLTMVVPLARPNARFAPVYVGNVADVMALALESPKSFNQRYDLCGPQIYTLAEIVHHTAIMLGLHRTVIPLPDGLAHLQAMLMEHLPGKLLTRDNLRSLSIDSTSDSAAAWDDFDITPTPVDAVMPAYFGRSRYRDRYMKLRQSR